MKNFIILLLLLVVIAVGVYFFMQTNSQEPNEPPIPGEITYNLKQELTPEEASRILALKYTEYSPENLTAAQAKGRAVLFFHATWCPTCKIANEDLVANSNRLPEDVTILKTDYDTYTDLKQKYGITYQHTFVQVDNDGNELAKWNGGGVAEILQNLK